MNQPLTATLCICVSCKRTVPDAEVVNGIIKSNIPFTITVKIDANVSYVPNVLKFTEMRVKRSEILRCGFFFI